jgi:hypothetical protein
MSQEILSRLSSMSTEIAVVVIAVVSAFILGSESKDILLAAIAGLVGYLSKQVSRSDTGTSKGDERE